MRTYICTVLGLLIFTVIGNSQRNCGSTEYLLEQINQNPERSRVLNQIEEHTQNFLRQNDNYRAVVTIPVVVHIVYNSSTENLSVSQIQSQIDVLNEDFRRLNSDANNTWSQAADTEIQFCLASVDPAGNSTSGITRTSTSRTSFSTGNDMKFNSSGGINAWPASDYMNIWVCDISGGILGYAQFPGGPASTDGIVIDYKYFGTIGTATAPFNRGRTGTHEVGHYLNLRHIWGDGGCSLDDFVSDTPSSDGPNYGCETNHTSCSSTDMVQNYMDYSDDACMNLFTQGQKSRMQALFSSGGARASLLNSGGCGQGSSPTCSDGVQNGSETGVDCGGPDCSPCGTGGNCTTVEITIITDNYPGETRWTIKNSSGTTVASGGPYSVIGATYNSTVCIDDGCYEFEITDSYGDGICCNYGSGSYLVTTGSSIWASGGNFASSETTNFCVDNNGSGPTDPTCNDGVQNGNETGIDCGGPDCAACPTCNDGIQNGNETGVDCGGPDCGPCGSGATCNDGVQNGNETGVDCGGPDCAPCPTCNDGVQNGNETGVDCGGSDCAACPTCNDGLQNGTESGVDCGGPDCIPCATCSDGIQNGNETGIDCGGNCDPCNNAVRVNIFGSHFETGWDGWVDGGGDCYRYTGTNSYEGNNSIRLRDNSGTSSSMTSSFHDLSDYNSMILSFYFYANSMENGEDFWVLINNGSGWSTIATYTSGTDFANGQFYTVNINLNTSQVSPNTQFRLQCDASSNADQVYIDAVSLTGIPNSGGNIATCIDGQQNGNETGIDCGGPDCAPCPTCTDGQQNGNETGVDCGGPDCGPCSSGSTCSDGQQNGNETGIDCGGPDCAPCPTCTDGQQNGNETGVDCGGPDCAPCPTCTDGQQNGSETGVDCGGPDCAACPTCTDGIQNGNETGVDCGGGCDPCNSTGSSVIFGSYFESGWDGWTDGGSDCYRYNSSSRAYEGAYSIRLRDNSDVSSSMTSSLYSLSEFSAVELEFYFYPNSMENGEDFFVRYNSGAGWQTVATYESGTHFSNGSFYVATVTLDASQFNLTSNAQFRIQCDASANSDQIYVDQVILTGYHSTRIAGSGQTIELAGKPGLRGPRMIEYEGEFSIVPNPATDVLNINSEEEFTKISVFSLDGRLIEEINTSGHSARLNVSQFSPGMYLIALEGSEEVLTERFIKQ